MECFDAVIESSTLIRESAATNVSNLQMNGVAEETALQAPYRPIKSKKATTPNATESKSKLSSVLQDKLNSIMQNTSNHIGDSDLSPDTSIVNGVADKADVTPSSTSKSSSLVHSPCEVISTGVTASSLANVVLVSPSTTTVGNNVESLKNSKLYVLNGNVLKEVNDVDKVNADKMNFVCVSANNLGSVIKKIQSENAVQNGKSLVGGGEADGDKSKLLSTVPTFIQLSHPSLQSVSSPKIAFTVSPTIVTKPSANNHEILRSKLLESPSAADQPVSKAKGGADKRATASKKELMAESPAVAKARSDLVRCRKALIEAAIHPQLPTYAPPAYYTGPTYSCEECEDTFASPEGLSKHKNRRSVLFTYACPVCKKTLEFYSRCMFLLHVRSHDVAVKACFLTISIIPANKLNFAVLDGQMHRNEVEPVPLFDPAERTSSVGDKATSGVSSLSNQIVQLFKKRKASSVDEHPDDRPIDVDGEPVCVDRLEISDSSSDDVTAVDTAESLPQTPDEPASTTRSAKVKKKPYLKNLLTDPVLKPATIDRTTTYTTANCTVTTVTASHSNSVEPSASPQSGRSTPLPPKGTGSSAETATTLDEIHLTSSDEDEPVPADEPEDHRIPCRECHQEVPNLTSHFRASNRPLREYPCEKCKFFNPSPCALAAHTRMHTCAMPYICPDCGFYFSTAESFLMHVKQVCFYDYKAIRFKCPECSLLKPSVSLFIEHLKRCHIREVFKCSVCITSSYLERIVKTHMERSHPETTPSVLEGYRCLLCPNVLVAKQSINVHVKKHVFGLQHLRYVYICKFCKKYATGRMTKFREHYLSCPDRGLDSSSPGAMAVSKQPSPTVARRSPEKAPSAQKALSAEKASSAKKAPSAKKTSPAEKALLAEKYVPTEKDPLSMEDWEADRLKAEYVPKTKCCVMCRITKLNEHSKSLFCKACVSYVNAADVSRASLADGAPPGSAEKVEGVAGSRSKRKLKCKLCKKLLNRDWSIITNHYLQDHNADLDAGVSKCRTQDVPPAPTRKRKSSALKHEPPATSTSGGDSATVASSSAVSATTASSSAVSATTTQASVTPIKVAKVECKYRCVRCGYSTNVRNDFHEHIVSHKAQSNTKYQCLECGACFIVKPSLKVHLIVEHKVRDMGEYDKDGSDEDADDESKEKAVAENQCEVCYMQCDSKQQYDRHMRTHGMAFVAKQSRAKS